MKSAICRWWCTVKKNRNRIRYDETCQVNAIFYCANDAVAQTRDLFIYFLVSGARVTDFPVG